MSKEDKQYVISIYCSCCLIDILFVSLFPSTKAILCLSTFEPAICKKENNGIKLYEV